MKIINNPAILKSIKFETVTVFGFVYLIAIWIVLKLGISKKIATVILLKRLFFLIRKNITQFENKI